MKLQNTYDKILNVVCEELKIKPRLIMSASHEKHIMFACGLYMRLVNDMELDPKKAILLINKSRPTIPIYKNIVEQEIKSSITSHEHYIACCKALNIKLSAKDKFGADHRLSEAFIRQKIGKLPKNNHYTMAEEIAIIRAMESSAIFMREYGKGVQPLKEGYAITRKH